MTGYRNLQKGLLFALLQPRLPCSSGCRTRGDFTRLMVEQEQFKTMPLGEVWDEYCRRCGKPVDGEWFPQVLETKRMC